jgi:hypothetical protein
MTDMERTKHAADFLSKMAGATEAEVAEIMQDGLGNLMIAGLAGYAENVAGQGIKTLGDAKSVAKAMITLGYLLRVSEEKSDLEQAALALTGGYRL